MGPGTVTGTEKGGPIAVRVQLPLSKKIGEKADSIEKPLQQNIHAHYHEDDVQNLSRN
jgi:hypothetical protein